MKGFYLIVKDSLFISFEKKLNLRGTEKTNKMKNYIYRTLNLDSSKIIIIFVKPEILNTISNKYKIQIKELEIEDQFIKNLSNIYSWKVQELLGK